MQPSILKVRLLSPWTRRVETSSAVFDRDIKFEDADALLCEWAPHEELFRFPRRKAWYCCEPSCQFKVLGDGTWPTLRDRLRPGEFLCHGHVDRRFRVPHITHFEKLQVNDRENRIDRAVAIVSNHGGSVLFTHPHIRYRNRLITSPLVDLFGRCGWNRYRRHWYSWPRPPRNYMGEIPGDWPGMQKRELMSRYKVCVCLENMNEPGYFSEKFVESVRAGCIPVYRASKDVRDTVLKGACWFDPSDTRWPESEAIKAACLADSRDILLTNRRWITTSPDLSATESSAVFSRIASILESSE